MQKIKKGDEVIVIAGRSKGQRGNVLKRREDGRLLVENVNMVKKHVKGNPRSGDRHLQRDVVQPAHPEG